MRKASVFIVILLQFISSLGISAQGGDDRQLYIAQWKDVAIAQMYEHGIPASITMAQAILESGNGRSMLSVKANNHFGIKCHGWDGPGVFKDDDKKNECFRKYRNAQESFEDHSQFLKKSRYEFLYAYDRTDYKAWAKGLKKAGYATDPHYAKRLIDLIEDNGLHEFDNADLVASNRAKDVKSRPRFEDEREVTSQEREVIDLTLTRKVLMHPNSIKFVKAKQGDSLEGIAKDLEMATWQIKSYNDLPSGYKFSEGETVFLQPKKKKSSTKLHVAIGGETLREISQKYGVKLKKLEQYNSLSADAPLTKGVKVLLTKPKS